MKILRCLPRPAESETLRRGPAIQVITNSLGDTDAHQCLRTTGIQFLHIWYHKVIPETDLLSVVLLRLSRRLQSHEGAECLKLIHIMQALWPFLAAFLPAISIIWE